VAAEPTGHDDGAREASAASFDHSLPAVSGYDVVSFQRDTGPLRGSGHHVSLHEGVTYLFASEENRSAFERNPDGFVPAYGGYCAYGVAVGKKLVGDPDVWAVVDGRLYLNLDPDIQSRWSQDVAGHIEEADRNWSTLRDRDPASI
jgi:hypothetical protein